jgi:hypothetical protein
MSEICIPIPELKNGQRAEIVVKNNNEEGAALYRVEIFQGNSKQQDENSLNNEKVFTTFKQFIDNYDQSWELLQVIASQEDHNTIKLLYRKR